jgi:hypothetical protein
MPVAAAAVLINLVAALEDLALAALEELMLLGELLAVML